MSTWKVAGETGTGRGASEGLTSLEFSVFLWAAQTSPQWNYGQNHRKLTLFGLKMAT